MAYKCITHTVYFELPNALGSAQGLAQAMTLYEICTITTSRQEIPIHTA